MGEEELVGGGEDGGFSSCLLQNLIFTIHLMETLSNFKRI